MKDLIRYSEEFLKKFSKSTFRAYSGDIMNYVQYLNKANLDWRDLDQVKFDLFKAYLEKENYSPKSIYRKQQCIKVLYDFIQLKENSLIIKLNVAQLDNSEYKTEPIPIDNLVQVINYTDEKTIKTFAHKVILILTIKYGLQRSEIKNLRINSVRNKNDSIFLKFKDRTIFLSKEDGDTIDSYLIRLEYEFNLLKRDSFLIQLNSSRLSEKPVDGATIFRIVKRYCDILPERFKPVSLSRIRSSLIFHDRQSGYTQIDIQNKYGLNSRSFMRNIRA